MKVAVQIRTAGDFNAAFLRIPRRTMRCFTLHEGSVNP